MRKLVVFVGLGLIVSVSAQAQPKVEIFGGYSYAKFDQDLIPSSLSGGESANGWGASLSVNANRFFGFTADFANQFGDTTIQSSDIVCIAVVPPPPGCIAQDVNFSSHQFLFGPRFTVRGAGTTAFVHVLVGAVRTRLSSLILLGTTIRARSETDLALGAGGGLDVKLSRLLALRAFQVDYIPVHQGGIINQDFAHNVRIQTGIVLRF